MFLIIAVVITAIAGSIVLLIRKKIIFVENKPVKIVSYSLLVIGIIYISLALLGGPVLKQINAYQQRVLSESEEECKQDDAPFWCHL